MTTLQAPRALRPFNPMLLMGVAAVASLVLVASVRWGAAST